jgi:hypothetical protein
MYVIQALTSWHGWAPAKSLADEGSEDRHVRHITESDHAIAKYPVDLLMENFLMLRVVTKRKAEALHGCSYRQSASNTVHADSVGSLEIGVEFPGLLVLEKGSHP